MKNAIRNRNRIAEVVSQAADAAGDAAIRRKLRDLYKEIMDDRSEVSDEKKDEELLEIAGTLTAFVREGQAGAVDTAIGRMRTLLAGRAEVNKKGGKKMGLFGKIRESLGGKPKEDPAAAARNAADEALYKLEQEISVLSDRRKKEMDKLRGIIREAAGYEAGSFEYKQARMRASGIKAQIKLYENQIDTHFQALMNNQRYLQMIDNGLAMKNLASYIPDTAEADVILEGLNKDVEDMQDRQETFTGVLDEYGNKIGMSSRMMDELDDEFDRQVARQKAEQKKPSPVPASAEDKSEGMGLENHRDNQAADALSASDAVSADTFSADTFSASEGDMTEEGILDGNP